MTPGCNGRAVGCWCPKSGKCSHGHFADPVYSVTRWRCGSMDKWNSRSLTTSSDGTRSNGLFFKLKLKSQRAQPKAEPADAFFRGGPYRMTWEKPGERKRVRGSLVVFIAACRKRRQTVQQLLPLHAFA